MFVYDLRFHDGTGYSGHTMPILETIKPNEGETGWKYKVAEGHMSTTPGEGTSIESTTYTEAQIKGKFPNAKADDSGPGLRDASKKDDEGNRIWPLHQPGGREWKWSQFNR